MQRGLQLGIGFRNYLLQKCVFWDPTLQILATGTPNSSSTVASFPPSLTGPALSGWATGLEQPGWY